MQTRRFTILLILACSWLGCSTPQMTAIINASMAVAPSRVPADGVTSALTTVTVTTATGAAVAGVSVQVSCSSCTVAQAQATTDVHGTVNATVVSQIAGDATVASIVTSGNVTLTPSAVVHFMAVDHDTGTAASFVLSGIADALTAGKATDVTITALDPEGNRAITYGGTVQVTSSDPNATLPAAIEFTSADAGQKIITGGIAFATAGNQTLTVTDSTSQVSVTSAAIAVSAGAAQRLMLSTPPTSSRAGTSVPLTVSATDAYGNTASSYAGTVTFSSTDAQNTLPAAYTFTSTDAGTHAFSLALGTVGNQRVTVADAAIIAATWNIAVTPGDATSLELIVNANGIVAGQRLSSAVIVMDANGNVATDYRGTVVFTSTDPAAVLPEEGTLFAGTRVYTNETLLITAGAQTVIVSDALTASLTGTATVQVRAGAANGERSSLVASPNQALADGATPVLLSVFARDTYGNAVAEQPLLFTSSVMSDVFTGSQGVTDANGACVSSVVAIVPGPQTIKALVSGLELHTAIDFAATPCGATHFATHVDFAMPSPVAVALSDLDGDTLPDIVGASHANNAVSVVFNQNNANFSSATQFAVGSNPRSVAVADVDGDNQPDVVTVNEDSNSISVLIQQDVGFADAVNYPVGLAPQAVALGDINRDGHIDVVVANSNTMGVLLNQSNGTFAIEVSYVAGTDVRGIAVGDINGDNNLDIVVANANDATVGVYINKGLGGFVSQLTYPVNAEPQSVAIADLNNDGFADIVASCSGGTSSGSAVSVLLNNGSGTFYLQTPYTVGASAVGVALGDVSGDGFTDIVATNSADNTLSILVNNGSGSFTVQSPLACATTPRGVTVADINHDGRADIVVANANAVGVLINICR